MSSINVLSQVRQALHHLNPTEVREQAERPLTIALVANSADDLWRMEQYLCPPTLSAAKRAEVARMLYRIPPSANRDRTFDLEIWDRSLAQPDYVFTFDRNRPEQMVHDVLKHRPELALPLARYIFPFRKPVVDHIIGAVAKENALFSLATAIPDVIPLLSLPWALGEFASDTAFLTMNQIRMTFLLAAASDQAVGYREQKGEIGSICAGAFGFRAIARELVGKIPLGGGLIPKAAIAWTGTQVVGRSMERLYSIGYAYTRAERKSAYEQLLEKGRAVATTLIETFRRPQAT
jgi:hypothetical protein